MSDFWPLLTSLGDELGAHVLLSAAAIGLGIAMALPLAVWAGRSRSVSRAALGFASLVQTIPALALLALFFPILLSLRAVFGEGLPTLGFLPALLALALYALLPILRNAVTAQANLDPGVIEAAAGVGMTQGPKLRRGEAPGDSAGAPGSEQQSQEADSSHCRPARQPATLKPPPARGQECKALGVLAHALAPPGLGHDSARIAGRQIGKVQLGRPHVALLVPIANALILVELAHQVERALEFRFDIGVELDAKTSGGRVRTDFDFGVSGTDSYSKHRIMADLTGGGPRLYLRTSGGSIQILKR